MAKKSSAARQSAARRTQTATRGSSGAVLLVRPAESSADTEATAITATPVTKAATKPAPTPKREGSTGAGSAKNNQAPVTKPVVAAPKPAAPAPKPVTKPAPARQTARPSGAANVQRNNGRGGRGMTAREQEIRLARARATQRARAANMITPEHYSYVLGDLRLILAVAAIFVVILVVLHFVLPV